MIGLAELIRDEIEAIRKYQSYLDQEPHSKKIVKLIVKIRNQEKMHLKLLSKL